MERGGKYERRTSFTAPDIKSYTWRIERFSRVRTKVLYSDVFEAGGYKWRAVTYPSENNTDYLSLGLSAADSASLPDGWSTYVEFTLKVVNQIEDKYSVTKAAKHKFTKLQSDWGFKYVIPLGVLFDPSRGYLVNDTLVVEIEVTYNKDEKDTAEHLRNGIMQERLKKDREVKKVKNKEKEDAHLYTIIKVIRDEDLAEQIGKDIYFNLVDHGKVRSFRVQKQTSFNVFKEEVAKAFGIPARFQRFWLWANRLNDRYRPFWPLTYIEEAAPVGQFRDVFGIHIAELELFLEVERGLDLRPIAPLKKRKDDILLFFKLYDPERKELRYVGRLLVNCTDKPSEILTKLNKLAGYEPGEEIALYEEVFEPNVKCLPVDMKLTFQESKLESGDIICFQKDSSMDIVRQIPFRDVCSYLEYVHKRYPYVASSIKYVHNPQAPFCPSGIESEDEDSSEEESEDEYSSEEQNENITAEETNVDKIIEAQQSKGVIETSHDEGTSKVNSSKFVIKDLKEVDAMIDENVIAAIDKVLSEGITISVKSQHSVQEQEVSKLDPNLPEKLLQELWDIVFEGDLDEELFVGLFIKDNFNAVKEKIDANADLFSSNQLEQVSVFVDLFNNMVRVLEKFKNLKNELDSAKKSTRQDNKALKETRQEILISRSLFTTYQNQLNFLDAQIADLNAKLEKLQGDRANMVKIQDQEKDRIASLNKEVKSIFHRLSDDQIKLKSVEDQIPEAIIELEKVYELMRAVPPF